MRRTRRRPLHYEAVILHDGTVLAAYPMRRPAPRILRRDGVKVEPDGVIAHGSRNGQELSDWTNEGRTRFQDIIAINLNGRRALRELVCPMVAALQGEVAALRREVAQIRGKLGDGER